MKDYLRLKTTKEKAEVFHFYNLRHVKAMRLSRAEGSAALNLYFMDGDEVAFQLTGKGLDDFIKLFGQDGIYVKGLDNEAPRPGL